MKLLSLLISIIMLHGCFPDFKSSPEDKLFLKEIKNGNVQLEWFFYSTVSSETPDYITIQEEGRIDTICIANNIADLNLNSKKIIIGFYGKPQKYMKSIKIPATVMNYEIIIDTNYILKTPVPRKFYKKE
ncbi:MAG TPA: hypothetical protein VF421_01105 [Niabella sp.]